jgi:hypothetical protein
MPTLMQKIRLAIRGWSRRREEAEKEFLAKNVWGPASAGPEVDRLKPAATQTPVDTEGLTVAYLDDSGRIAYYLDTETGEVVDVRDGTVLAPPRYRRVPARSEQTDAEDRRAFAAEHEALAGSVASAEAFRRVLSGDRKLERAWYNFKNDRAIAAIEEWLK